jgi:hypothetical protein
MKGDLKVAGFGVNIMHGVNIPWWVIASTLVLDREEARTKQEQYHYPRV